MFFYIDGHLHWSQSASDDSDSLSVEISSYVLLAVLTTAEVTAADLGYANRIVSWLVRQQNPYGGYQRFSHNVIIIIIYCEYNKIEAYINLITKKIIVISL